eukprot:8246501-Pyramimonas_sp.AAC.1
MDDRSYERVIQRHRLSCSLLTGCLSPGQRHHASAARLELNDAAGEAKSLACPKAEVEAGED